MSLTEVVWHGRGGQGAKTAGYILAEAAMDEGKMIQAFPEFGAERRGAPIKSYVRISDAPIRLRCGVTNPGVVIVLDDTLLPTVNVAEGLLPEGTIIVNSEAPPADLRKWIEAEDAKLYTVDASEIAVDCFKRDIPNTPMLGALAKTTDLVSLDGAQKAVRKKLGKKLQAKVIEGNLQAIQRAYEEVQGE